MITQGKNVVVFFEVDSEWVGYVCPTNVSAPMATDFIKTSVSGSGIFATSLPTENSISVSLEGILSLNEDGSIDFTQFRAWQIAQTLIHLTNVVTDDGGNVYTEEFHGYISASDYSGPNDGAAGFNITINITGAITQTITPFLRFRSRVQVTGNPFAFLFYLEGTPATGDQVTVHLVVSSTDHPFTYTVLGGDTIEDIIDALFALIDADPAFTPSDYSTGILTTSLGLASGSSVEITLA